MTDWIAQLMDFLEADSDISELVEGRIYGLQLSPSESANMPRHAIVLKLAGGLPSNDFLKIQQARIDVFSYGETPLRAWDLYRRTHVALKNLVRERRGDTLMHGASIESGPVLIRDDQTDWPAIVETYNVTVSEAPIAA